MQLKGFILKETQFEDFPPTYFLLNGVKDCKAFTILHCAAGNGFQFKLGTISISVLFLANLGKMSFITYNKNAIDLVCDFDSYIIGINGSDRRTSVI